jgi:hypothetical protein
MLSGNYILARPSESDKGVHMNDGLWEEEHFHIWSKAEGLVLLVVLGFELWALCLLSKHSTIELCLQPKIFCLHFS